MVQLPATSPLDTIVFLYFHFSLSLICRSRPSILFPYTTLFRSRPLKLRFDDEALISRPWSLSGFMPGHIEQPEPRQSKRSEEHTSELQSPCNLVCRLLLEKKKKTESTDKEDVVHRAECKRTHST